VPRSPGVYLQARRVRETRAVEPPTGIPVFVGFADAPRGRGGAALVIDRWSAPVFEQAVRPDGASFLPMAVHGFFANGGRRCIVMAVPPAAGSAGLVDALQPGGPLEDRSEPDLVCVPDAMLHADATFPYLVQDAALRHCERMGDRFAILDAPRLPDAAGDDLVDAVLLQAAALRSAYGALFFRGSASTRETPMMRRTRTPATRRHGACCRGSDPSLTTAASPSGPPAAISPACSPGSMAWPDRSARRPVSISTGRSMSPSIWRTNTMRG